MPALKVKNLLRTPCEVAGKLIPGRAEVTLAQSSIELWMERADENKRRLRENVAVRDAATGQDVDLLSPADAAIDPEFDEEIEQIPETEPAAAEASDESLLLEIGGGAENLDKAGKPKVAAASAALGRKVSARERDEIWDRAIAQRDGG